MLTSYSVNSFSNGGLGLQTIDQLAAKAMHQAASRQRYGLGAATDDWSTFVGGGATAYQDAARIVYCNRDQARNIQCVLQAYPAGSKARGGPVADMQRAIDQLVNKIPVWNMQVGQEATVTGPDGTVQQTRLEDKYGEDPIAHRSGYDGVVGPYTVGMATVAMILAGALRQVPIAVGKPFIEPTEENITAYAWSIAEYLGGVVADFENLLASYLDRGRVPATDVFEPATVPSLAPFVPPAGKISRNGAIIGAAAATAAITGIASYNAARRKPNLMYDDVKPSFGRRRRRRSGR